LSIATGTQSAFHFHRVVLSRRRVEADRLLTATHELAVTTGAQPALYFHGVVLSHRRVDALPAQPV